MIYLYPVISQLCKHEFGLLYHNVKNSDLIDRRLLVISLFSVYMF